MSRDENDYLNANFLSDDEDDEPSQPHSAPKPGSVAPLLVHKDVIDSKSPPYLPSSFAKQDLSPPQPSREAPPAPRSGRLAPEGGRLVIAIDYGTTYTGLAFTSSNSDQVDIRAITVIQKWTKSSNQHKVPSTLSYAAPTNGEAQWGSDISDSAITMVNTKLELEPLEHKFDELDLTLQVLTGTGYLEFDHIRKAGPDPAYTTKEPTEIVTDYLTKILECFRREYDVRDLPVTNTVVDIVVTVPVDWSYQAHKSMFQAIRGAGFNKETFPTLQDTMLVTEPEAASYFTSRDLLGRNNNILLENDCFILCDAGGGTVDVISFQVKRLKPHFELVKATKPSGGNHGSSLIDTRFKGWLRDFIGKKNYAKLDPANAYRERISPHTTETGPMRKLLEKFFDRKSTFSNKNQSDIKLNLPDPLDKLSIDGKVKEGQLTIPWVEMKEIMDHCVNGVIMLILEQIERVSQGKNRKVRNLFLVGGFGASPYLQEMLRKSLLRRKIELHRPIGIDDNQLDPSITAVVQGGVIYGVEKARHKDASYMTAVTRTYGVLCNGDFEWLIKSGDLILSNRETSKDSSKTFWHPVQSCVKGKCEFPFYYHLARSEDDDDYPERWQDGQHDVAPAGYVKCDFSNMMDRELRPLPGTLLPGAPSAAKSRSSIGPLSWRFKLSTFTLIAEILLNGNPIAKCEIPTESDWRERRRQSTHSADSWREQEDSD